MVASRRLMAFTYAHPRPALTVDCVVLGLARELEVLLVRRGLEPFRGAWALPGGFVRVDESLEDAARRELAEEAGARDVYLEQLFTFGELGRDPRERVVSVAYYALVRAAAHEPRAGTDAAEARWYPVAHLPPLAFDHASIVDKALARLRGKVRYAPVGFELLPERFALRDLQHLYEQVLGRPLDKRNFRKKVLATGLVVETGALEEGLRHRPARLFRFDRERYLELEKTGYLFEV